MDWENAGDLAADVIQPFRVESQNGDTSGGKPLASMWYQEIAKSHWIARSRGHHNATLPEMLFKPQKEILVSSNVNI